MSEVPTQTLPLIPLDPEAQPEQPPTRTRSLMTEPTTEPDAGPNAGPNAGPTTENEPRRPRGVRRVLLESGYALTAFPVSLAAFVAVVVLVSVGAALSIVIGGVVVVVLGVQVARGFAALERVRLREMLGRAAPNPRYLRARPGDGTVRKVFTPLRDPQSWLDVLWSLVGLITGTVAFAVAVVWWAASLGGLTYWFWERYLPERGAGDETLAALIGWEDTAEQWFGWGPRAADISLETFFGLVAVLTLPWAIRAAVALHAGLARVTLSSRAELQGRVALVEGSRDAARVAEAESLRRLERDIHDGPQQRLVRLGMDLGRARRQLEKDPARAAALLDDARRQTRETVDELRSLSRGIAPPLLVDRGLAAAVEELAGGSPVPATAVVDVPALPPHVETVAYFVVAECLTNIAKHSGATEATVRVMLEAEAGADRGSRTTEVRVEVTDDGIGGAHEGKGLGLAGLAHRVEAAEGTLEVDSPPGGPTVVRARIPLGTA